ncbi:MAG: hypothetical protein HFJ40_07155 [Clostridia bacterium]|nr:hypothetical protein [Clostridia bacterium]
MFKRAELIIRNANLKLENEAIEKENARNRDEITDLELKIFHAKVFAEDFIRQLNMLQEIDNRGNPEETKRKNKNLIINNLKKQSTNIIKELDASGKSI